MSFYPSDNEEGNSIVDFLFSSSDSGENVKFSKTGRPESVKRIVPNFEIFI